MNPISPAVSQWFETNGFSPDATGSQNSKGIYPLILACQQGRGDVVEFLIDNQADLNVLDEYGNNALWAACYAENEACLGALIKAGVNLDYQNTASGATALIYAASSGREKIVDLLLQAGANHALMTHDEFTALDLASTRTILKRLSTLSH